MNMFNLEYKRALSAALWCAVVVATCASCVSKSDISPDGRGDGDDDLKDGTPIIFDGNITRGEAYSFRLPSPGSVSMWCDQIDGAFRCDVTNSGEAIKPNNKVLFWEDFADVETLKFRSCYPEIDKDIVEEGGVLRVRQPEDILEQFDFMTTRIAESSVADRKPVGLLYEHKMALIKLGVAYVSDTPLSEDLTITKVSLSGVKNYCGEWNSEGEFVWGEPINEPYECYAEGDALSNGGKIMAYKQPIDGDYSKSFTQVFNSNSNQVMFIAPQPLGTFTIEYKIGDKQQPSQEFDLSGKITAKANDQIQLYLKIGINAPDQNKVINEDWYMDKI